MTIPEDLKEAVVEAELLTIEQWKNYVVKWGHTQKAIIQSYLTISFDVRRERAEEIYETSGEDMRDFTYLFACVTDDTLKKVLSAINQTS